MENLPSEITDEFQETYGKALELAKEHFVEFEDVTISMTQWQDGDFRIEIYHGFDTRRPDIHHGEQVKYNLFEEQFRYANFTKEHGWHQDRAFREYVIEEWTPTSTPSEEKE
jgi:hypothetical protein